MSVLEAVELMRRCVLSGDAFNEVRKINAEQFRPEAVAAQLQAEKEPDVIPRYPSTSRR